ncbi:MAG: phosphoribosyltransferase family protein [Microthrixaceae bacterium]
MTPGEFAEPSIDDDPRIGEILLTEDQIQRRITEIGEELSRDYAGEAPLLVCVLRGAYVFLTDLARAVNLPVEVDFIAVSSYGSSTRTSGVVRLVKDLDVDLSGRHVILVEDIVDTGLTLRYLRRSLERAAQPASRSAHCWHGRRPTPRPSVCATWGSGSPRTSWSATASMLLSGTGTSAT